MERNGRTRRPILVMVAMVVGPVLLSMSCNQAPPKQRAFPIQCMPFAQSACQCLDGSVRMQACAADGSSYSPCACDAAPATAGSSAGTAGASADGSAGTGSSAGMGSGGASGGAAAGGGAAADGGGGAAGAAGTAAGSGGAGGDGDDVDTARQACVDTINMYRATKGLPPMMRASMSDETCSDAGAKKDGDANDPHSSAGDCPGFGAQDSCPGWGVGGFSGSATLADAIKGCLKSMWDEGEPPVSRDACIKDYQNCFLKYGHYLNMTSDAAVVSCGFYQMSNGKWWMNQDFK